MKAVLCPVCWGKGYRDDGFHRSKCHGCGGKGWVVVPEDKWYPYVAPRPHHFPKKWGDYST